MIFGSARRRRPDMTEPRAALRVVAGLATVLACMLAVPSQSENAEEPKVWRQAMIAPKADAGFFLMAARRGFAAAEGLQLETINVKDDQVGMRALISGDVDSFDSATSGVIA